MSGSQFKKIGGGGFCLFFSYIVNFLPKNIFFNKNWAILHVANAKIYNRGSFHYTFQEEVVAGKGGKGGRVGSALVW